MEVVYLGLEVVYPGAYGGGVPRAYGGGVPRAYGRPYFCRGLFNISHFNEFVVVLVVI